VGAANEIAALVGPSWNNSIVRAKKIGLRGLDKVLPYWKTLPAYEIEGRIPPYSSCIDGYRGEDCMGISTYYASEVLGIPSLTLECASPSTNKFAPEKIALYTEILGNILLESYRQEVINVIPNIT
jgi:hypothetical protein